MYSFGYKVVDFQKCNIGINDFNFNFFWLIQLGLMVLYYMVEVGDIEIFKLLLVYKFFLDVLDVVSVVLQLYKIFVLLVKEVILEWKIFQICLK